jgi:hypothetical protein
MTARLGAARGIAVWAFLSLAWSQNASAYTVKQTGSGAIVRWHRSSVALRVDPSIDAFFTDMTVRPLIDDAANAWRDIEGAPDLLINAGDPGPVGFDSGRPASNGIYLVEDWELAESSLAVTVATYESKTGRLVDTDILVNPNHPFGVMPDGPDQKGKEYDLRGVMTHEMGHVLGLGESYEERMATMWPNISRGETHQRDIDADDLTGAEEAYAGGMLSETDPVGGCGGSSVVIRRGNVSSTFWILGVASAVALAWLLVRAGRRHVGVKGTAFCACALLFASPFQSGSQESEENERVEVVRTLALRRLEPHARQAGLARAARSTSARVRMAAAAVLERSGYREDRAIASRLALDVDPEIRRLGRDSLVRLQSAPPLARIARDAPEAQDRLAQLLGETRGLITGEAVSTGARLHKGLIWSSYAVQGPNGLTEVEIPGGTLGEHSQVVSEQEPPADGDVLVVALRDKGRHAWAHYREGLIYGGWLGEGPGIEWTP